MTSLNRCRLQTLTVPPFCTFQRLSPLYYSFLTILSTDTVMARQAGNDGDINRLNEMSYYVGVADFERPRLLLLRRVSHTLPPSGAIVSYLVEAGFGDTVLLKDFTFDNFLISTFVER
ncbi:uncharacterized protein DS421_10g309540 [Arachis hypogaea]|nr:uncharacterized protein DS421_10g309540 [Arachis hypogaea]